MTAIVIACISLTGAIIAATLSLRGQLANAKATENASQRADLWRMIDEKNKDFAAIKGDYEQLQGLYKQQAERLDNLERQRIRDQIMIEDLQQRVRTLGGSV